MSKWFSRDLDDGCLDDTKLWKALKEHISIPRDLPLPSTNSHTAKGMRVAASLRVFAHALSTCVFRPTYIVQDNSIDDALAELAKHNAEQDVYVRAALLKALPERQRRCREDGIRRAVQDVVEAVAGWIPEADVHEFHSELGAVTKNVMVCLGGWDKRLVWSTVLVAQDTSHGSPVHRKMDGCWLVGWLLV